MQAKHEVAMILCTAEGTEEESAFDTETELAEEADLPEVKAKAQKIRRRMGKEYLLFILS